MKNLTVFNLLGGPCVGKSTVAAGLFYELKKRHHKIELVTEFVKDRIYEGHLGCIEDQIYIFGQQQRRISRLVGNVDMVVTDSPIILSCLYSQIESKAFETLVYDVFSQYNNINIFLERNEIPYTGNGRIHDLEQAKELDKKLLELLYSLGIEHHKVGAGDKCVESIMTWLTTKGLI